MTQLQNFIDKATHKYGALYDYSAVNFINQFSRIDLKCRKHGIMFQVTPQRHLHANQRCPLCQQQDRADHFLEKATHLHDTKYDYSQVSYTTMLSPVSIICPIHGEFAMTPDSHLKRKQGCPNCNDPRCISLDEFLLRARQAHGNRYNYDAVELRGIETKVKIGCFVHGYFEIRPFAHFRLRQGCPSCGGTRRLTQSDFIARALTMHDNKYDYSLAHYTSAHKPVKIICPDHGIFIQTAWTHIFEGCGCPDCGMHNVRIKSRAANEWLDTLEIVCLEREKWISSLKRNVDGYDRATNTIYQFHGDYWHGNPISYEGSVKHPVIGLTYGELYERTLKRDHAIRDAGFNLVVIWEYEFYGKKNHGYKRHQVRM